MMQPMDPLSQLAMCCGLGNRRRELKPPRNYLYSPSHVAHLNQHESSWALANTYAPQPAQQPYLLLTQPVIIATNSGPNQTNHTMALIQHAQSAQNPPGFPYFPIVGSHQNPQMMQPNIVSSQYAIYNSIQPASGLAQAPMASIQERREHASLQSSIGSQNIYHNPKALGLPPPPGNVNRNQTHQSAERKVATLSSQVFRQLELIEKHVDLSADLETVEKYGVVITRALDPYSLTPHLTESTMREYNERYLLNDGYVVKFIEIIKRPGQTLGLYIRTIRFEDPQGRGPRSGVVITKIDTDSPVYNSPILHVGDEIISVNLIDVNGMSLDNVVVIMSIPRRLVLALRIPRGRLSNIDSMHHQHHALRESVDGREALAAGKAFVDQSPQRPQPASFNDYQYQIGDAQNTNFESRISSNIKQPVISSIRLGDTSEQSSYFSSSIDAINRELKELRMQRMALSENEQGLDLTRVEY